MVSEENVVVLFEKEMSLLGMKLCWHGCVISFNYGCLGEICINEDKDTILQNILIDWGLVIHMCYIQWVGLSLAKVTACDPRPFVNMDYLKKCQQNEKVLTTYYRTYQYLLLGATNDTKKQLYQNYISTTFIYSETFVRWIFKAFNSYIIRLAVPAHSCVYILYGVLFMPTWWNWDLARFSVNHSHRCQ